MLQTEFPFRLPLGYVDGAGDLQRDGVMRLATAFDEITPLKDPRVQANPGYLLVVLLARVITRLGTIAPINPKTIEGLFAGDLAFLQAMYQRVNASSANQVRAHCPHCEQAFDVELSGLGGSGPGESGATP